MDQVLGSRPLQNTVSNPIPTNVNPEEERIKALVTTYHNVPESAKTIVTSLKKLDIKLTIGINYQSYSADLEHLYPDLRLFLESAEIHKYPELRFYLSNAADCHMWVRDTWGTELHVKGKGADAYIAGLFNIVARPVLWKVASANVAGAEVLISGNDQDIANFIQTTFPNTCHEVSILAACLAIVKQGRPEILYGVESFPAGVLERCRQQAEINEKAAEQWRELNELFEANKREAKRRIDKRQ